MVPRPATWVFDVDGSVIDSHTGTSLRPGTRELLESLRSDGHRVVWWSAGGAAYAAARATSNGVADLVDEFAAKDTRDADGRYHTDHFLGADDGAVFVDDRPEDLPLGAAVIAVAPYIAANPHDRALHGLR